MTRALTQEQCRAIAAQAGVNLLREDLGEIRLSMELFYQVIAEAYEQGSSHDLLRIRYKTADPANNQPL